MQSAEMISALSRREYESDSFFNPVAVNFGNHELKKCKVEVTVTGEMTEFDKYVEFYGPRGLDSDKNLQEEIEKNKVRRSR